MLHNLAYYITHLEAVLYPVATVLWYPVLVIETLALIYIVFEFGVFTLEWARRDRRRSLARIESAASSARSHMASGHGEQAAHALGTISHDWLFSRFATMLASGADLSRARLAKVLGEVELTASKRLDRTRIWIRLGPMIGLVTTLIPISPALVALAKGDLQTLSNDLVIAFSTTVIGLLISGIAFLISTVRERFYLQDVSDVEYALELLEV